MVARKLLYFNQAPSSNKLLRDVHQILVCHPHGNDKHLVSKMMYPFSSYSTIGLTLNTNYFPCQKLTRSHLIPCFFFAYLLYKNSINQNMYYSDKICLGAFIAGALICHIFSVCYHSFNCHSQRVSRLFKK